ncbi:PbsX family transcriptional regulator [Escherichia coli]
MQLDEHILRPTACYSTFSVKLTAANICNEHFWLLIELSGVRSEKIIMSLKDYLVDGFSKKEACEKNGVSLSYFSVTLKKLSYINNISALLSEYYHGDC